MFQTFVNVKFSILKTRIFDVRVTFFNNMMILLFQSAHMKLFQPVYLFLSMHNRYRLRNIEFPVVAHFL